MERISIFGLGYVGTVCAACFARMGHQVIGIDPSRTKVDLIELGKSPIIERDIDAIIADVRKSGRLTVSQSVEHAVAETEISMVCVGTPGAANGSLNLDAVGKVATQIGDALKRKDGRHVVIIRSTVLPGTVANIVVPALEGASGKKIGSEIELAVNPEFMREGSAVADFDNPARTIVGSAQMSTAERVMGLYRDLPGEKIVTAIETAELAKYVDNAWHALKVAFGNEIGTICKSVGIDSHELMDVFLADRKLNISNAYLRPGFAFGGSCLPKDLRALNHFASTRDLDLPVLRNILKSNTSQIGRGIDWVLGTEARKISLLGLSFKQGTDDLRESPFLDLVETLIGKGRDLQIFDANVEMSRLIGANRDFLLERIPHIAELLVPTLEEAMAHGEVIVIAQSDPAYSRAPELLTAGQRVLDFTRAEGFAGKEWAYDGFSW